MKTIMKFTVAAVIMFSTIGSFANDEITKSIFKKKEDKVFVNLYNLDKDKVEIKIYDSQNRVVYAETIVDSFLVKKVFNFESAFEDSYTLVIKKEGETYKKSILVD
jgi:flagellar hook assembly protein FlgD